MRLLRGPAKATTVAPTRLALGCAPLDALLGGGVETGALTEVFGAAGTGKTNLCLQLAREVARAGGRVLYLDSEGFSGERLAQLCGDDLALVERRLLVERVATLAEQARAAERAARIARGVDDVRLVVVDSATLLYRVQLAEGEGVGERRALLRTLHKLCAAARERQVAVVATNQVFSIPGQEDVQALGGHGLRHLAACVVRLERLPAPGARSAVLLKHRSRPEGLRATFRLESRGLGPLQRLDHLDPTSTDSPKRLSRAHGGGPG
ncbi:MAG TPA: DNA repair and recombination protein RadB [Candidatus Thermoplasmatota archaeon]|nr:DNA repair and recombination protein RadB [Candidatus Thermoplasmatota archaeon]